MLRMLLQSCLSNVATFSMSLLLHGRTATASAEKPVRETMQQAAPGMPACSDT